MNNLYRHAGKYLQTLCTDFPSRRVGNPNNQAAARYVSSVMEAFGLEVETQSFACTDHRSGEIRLSCGGSAFTAFISPHSLGCDLSAELASASNLEELRNGDFQGKILLLKGELAKEQLLPKNYPFYKLEPHQEIYKLLESRKPAAIISATGRNPELAGAPYPFPLIEDGDFDIPSAYMTDVEGERLNQYVGRTAALKMDAERIPSHAENVIARTGNAEQDRLVVCAHIDAKYGTPGAVDNASGVVTLMLLGELLGQDLDSPCVELVAFNGEDHYSAGGELAFLDQNQGKLDSIRLVINIDGAGFRGYLTEVSFYGCPQGIEECASRPMKSYSTLKRGEPWPQSDHMIFAMQQIPAMAVTTAAFMKMETEIAHTEKDVPDQVDINLLVETALYIHEVLAQCGKA